MRPSGRAPDEMRAINIETGFTKHAEGSCLISFGETKVLCNASIEDRTPPWLRGKGEGWVTAEYSMLPRSTHTRSMREAVKGKLGGRTQEIQRLIGRSLRSVVDLKKLGERQITVDCDVLQADGGTRTASISGAWVALRLAIDGLMKQGLIREDPINAKIAAISCGIYKDTPVLDLDYPEDSNAEADANFVLIEGGKIAEAQATAEGAPFDEEGLLRLLRLARIGCDPEEPTDRAEQPGTAPGGEEVGDAEHRRDAGEGLHGELLERTAEVDGGGPGVPEQPATGCVAGPRRGAWR